MAKSVARFQDIINEIIRVEDIKDTLSTSKTSLFVVSQEGFLKATTEYDITINTNKTVTCS